jgi:hypothetical protein
MQVESPRVPSNPVPAPPPSHPIILQPGKDTVVATKEYQLTRYSLVINTTVNVLICTMCNIALAPSNAESHVKAHPHNPAVPPGMISALVAAFHLLNPASVVLPTDSPSALFGLWISPILYKICGRCKRGFSTDASLARHRCSGTMGGGNSVAHVQRLQGGQNSSCFPVTVDERADDALDQIRAQIANLDLRPPKRDDELICVSYNQMQKSIFVGREGWDTIMRKITPAQAQEICRLSTKDDEMHGLARFVVAWVPRLMQPLTDLCTLGEQRLLARMSEYGFFFVAHEIIC